MTVYNFIMGELVWHKLLFIAQHDLICNLDVAVCVQYVLRNWASCIFPLICSNLVTFEEYILAFT
jgi:hypothetical protein